MTEPAGVGPLGGLRCRSMAEQEADYRTVCVTAERTVVFSLLRDCTCGHCIAGEGCYECI
jgi:hypothetical protein